MKSYSILFLFIAASLFSFEKAWELPISGTVENFRFTNYDKEFTYNIGNKAYRGDAETGKLLDSIEVNLDTLKKYGVTSLYSISPKLQFVYNWVSEGSDTKFICLDLKTFEVKVLSKVSATPYYTFSGFGFSYAADKVIAYFSESYSENPRSAYYSGECYIYRDSSKYSSIRGRLREVSFNTFTGVLRLCSDNSSYSSYAGETRYYDTFTNFLITDSYNKVTAYTNNDINKRPSLSNLIFTKNDSIAYIVFKSKDGYVGLTKINKNDVLSTMNLNLKFDELSLINSGFQNSTLIYRKGLKTYLYDFVINKNLDSIENFNLLKTNMRYDLITEISDNKIKAYGTKYDFNYYSIDRIDDTLNIYSRNLNKWLIKVNNSYDSIKTLNTKFTVNKDTLKIPALEKGVYEIKLQVYTPTKTHNFTKIINVIEKPVPIISHRIDKKTTYDTIFDYDDDTDEYINYLSEKSSKKVVFTHEIIGDFTKFQLKLSNQHNEKIELNYDSITKEYSFDFNRFGYYYINETIDDILESTPHQFTFMRDTTFLNVESMKYYGIFHPSIKVWNDTVYMAKYNITETSVYSSYYDNFVKGNITTYKAVGVYSVYTDDNNIIKLNYLRTSSGVSRNVGGQTLALLGGDESLLFTFVGEDIHYEIPMGYSIPLGKYQNGVHSPSTGLSFAEYIKESGGGYPYFVYYDSDFIYNNKQYLTVRTFNPSSNNKDHPINIASLESPSSFIMTNYTNDFKIKENSNKELISTFSNPKSVEIHDSKIDSNKLIHTKMLFNLKGNIVDVFTTKNVNYVVHKDSNRYKVTSYNSVTNESKSFNIDFSNSHSFVNLYSNDERYFTVLTKSNNYVYITNIRTDSNSRNTYKIKTELPFVLSAVSKNGELYLISGNKLNVYDSKIPDPYLIKTNGNRNSLKKLFGRDIFAIVDSTDGGKVDTNQVTSPTSNFISQSADYSQATIHLATPDDNSSIVIYNPAGTVVSEVKIANKEKEVILNTSTFPIGYYFVRLKNDKGEENIGKFIIVR
jgi:hypothetical protein